MEEKKEKELITEVFIKGARKGWDVATHSTIPNVLMAFVIIYFLTASGLLKLIGEYAGFLMSPVGLPGQAIAVLLAAFLSMGGAAGVVVALFTAGQITVDHVAILIPAIILLGSTVQYMGRILGVLGVASRHFGILFLICIINAYCAMFVMNILIG
ncbi:MAG: YjiG family protein [Alphaproteobacteria bacterium]|jgi:spore maturation protein SpmB|nr:YjiG family protein [Alphaproteobacteria bacterium]